MTGRRRLAAGLDVGGSKVAGVLLDEEGTVTARSLLDSPADEAASLTEAVFASLGALAGHGDPAAVGIGIAGMVEASSGVVRYGPNIAWRDLSIRDLVAERVRVPCVVDNDANVAAVGEARYGAGQGAGHLLVVTVGTGIGGGIVIDGVLHRGAHGFAAEIGHIIVEPGGPPCGCGNLGCWEQVASGQALDRLAREEVEAHPRGAIGRAAAGGSPAGPDVAAAAAVGDPAATRILAEVSRRLGEGLAGGGGVAAIGEPFLAPARAAFREALEAPDHRPEVPILQAVLGNEAGAIGAASLALELVS